MKSGVILTLPALLAFSFSSAVAGPATTNPAGDTPGTSMLSRNSRSRLPRQCRQINMRFVRIPNP